ncbi:MAG: S-methyl-5-thioribose-1-phosphate isomerase [Thermoplasmata archaeon]|nr:S-methyl-5-thioribose-1-phosphate isomerase [Euryarchaeota archaeon]RLF67316.1 MAG: S-methyl-5-thioribose-1-phosphate isomerase [Thermoplasmata archaeon]
MRVIIGGKPVEMRSVWAEDGIIKLIDQRRLPRELVIFEAKTLEDVAFAIKEMVVRGAPAIGITAAYGMALAHAQGIDPEHAASVLRNTRPTAHDLFFAIDYMLKHYDEGWEAAEQYANDVIEKARLIGVHGEPLIEDEDRILTHCNAGALAVGDWGTALAPIRMAHRNGKKVFVYVDETRPRLQGMLTAWELLNEGIDHVIIPDNAAGYFMWRGEIDLVIVGADRIALNGDFANKIGTYEKAVLAKENGIPFFVAAPITTFDPNIENGMQIPIEERSEQEVLSVDKPIPPPKGSRARNPAFDVTPHKYLTGIITEYGIIYPPFKKNIKKLLKKITK